MKTQPIKVEDYRSIAKRRLPSMIFDYLDGGAEDEYGLQHNRTVLRNIRFKPRRLIDVSQRDYATTLFGKSISAPMLIGPTGFNDLFWPKGDLALARAAAAHCIPFVLSTPSNMSIEALAHHCDGDLWFQLYVTDRQSADRLIKRALQANYSSLVLTVDVPVGGYRERDLRNGFALPFKYRSSTLFDGLLHPRWALRRLRYGMPRLANFENTKNSETQHIASVMARRMDASFDLDGLAWLREKWPRKLLVKGIMHPEDAAHAEKCGVDGLIISNHGGRQLDSCLSPLEILPAISEVTDLPILMDSGFRRGADIVKAIALGAHAVCLGRATLYGLATNGEEGVSHVIGLLKNEIDMTMAQIGCRSLAQLSTDHLIDASGVQELA
jgi:(S)-mandelate dehydrogenase